MKAYEGVFIFPPEASPEARKNQEKNLEDVLKKFGGKILQRTEWGRRPLGYPLKKFREGHFLILDFQVESIKMTELRKMLELQEDLLKFMLTIKNLSAEKKSAPASTEKVATSATHPTATPTRS